MAHSKLSFLLCIKVVSVKRPIISDGLVSFDLSFWWCSLHFKVRCRINLIFLVKCSLRLILYVRILDHLLSELSIVVFHSSFILIKLNEVKYISPLWRHFSFKLTFKERVYFNCLVSSLHTCNNLFLPWIWDWELKSLFDFQLHFIRKRFCWRHCLNTLQTHLSFDSRCEPLFGMVLFYFSNHL